MTKIVPNSILELLELEDRGKGDPIYEFVRTLPMQKLDDAAFEPIRKSVGAMLESFKSPPECALRTDPDADRIVANSGNVIGPIGGDEPPADEEEEAEPATTPASTSGVGFGD